MYFFIIIDRYRRKIVDFELSITFGKVFVVSFMRQVLAKAKPEIIKSDQGGHFTNTDYIYLLRDA